MKDDMPMLPQLRLLGPTRSDYIEIDIEELNKKVDKLTEKVDKILLALNIETGEAHEL